jgi:acetoin utilization protein AcuB
MTRQLQVRDYMTTAPHAIGLEQTLAQAEKRMRELSVRHLPVLHGGRLRGIISARDIALVRALDVDPREVRVEEALTGEPYTVSEQTPLHRVARAMAAHKYDCAVAIEHGKVKGILTVTDALRALASALEKLGPPDEAMSPSQVREVIMAEHAHIRGLLDRAEENAKPLLSARAIDDEAVVRLKASAMQLYTSLGSHMELENRVLAPALESIDAWGRVRAEGLRREHADQKRAIDAALKVLVGNGEPPRAVAESVLKMVQLLRNDLELEEETLLSPRLLQDLPAVGTADSE